MDQTFMSIHNLSRDANILFTSDSIVDILGYQPHEVLGKSCFDFFHPDEVPFARSVHDRGVLLDKAAVLHYARILSKDGRWVSCECCFTVVHDVLVACISVYRRGRRSERRAIEAPQIRRIFSSSPRDPRYHMLEHLSPKFRVPPTVREPRAALILNRFTRTLTIMFATDAVSSILGLTPEQLRGKSLYECIAENCLADAIKCLESAKANDSIAYMRFWSRDPRMEEDLEGDEDDVAMEDREEDEPERGDWDSDGGVRLNGNIDTGSDSSTSDTPIKSEDSDDHSLLHTLNTNGSSSQHAPTAASGRQPPDQTPNRARRRRPQPLPPRELEAVVSCTSDGLVMVVRKARPLIPTLHSPLLAAGLANGLFAAPWGDQPVRPHYPPDLLPTLQPPHRRQYMGPQDHVEEVGGPPTDQLMRSIRDVAVFAWGLVGINGTLASYAHGEPRDEAQPPNGLPVWDPTAPSTSYRGPEPPSSSTLRRNQPTNEYSARYFPPGRSTYTAGTAGVRQSHTQTLGPFDNMGPSPSHLSNRTWQGSSTTAPALGGGIHSYAEQSSVGENQTNMTAHGRRADSNVREPHSPTTETSNAGYTRHNSRYPWG
ncbi:hypothetical protein F5Y17DRAFT_474070 [Xylariaceae sp. FL0594]|nr:hypothetical protein F5Y17DRAFT_474070 [Xylariaceae sp. FL0594]